MVMLLVFALVVLVPFLGSLPQLFIAWLVRRALGWPRRRNARDLPLCVGASLVAWCVQSIGVATGPIADRLAVTPDVNVFPQIFVSMLVAMVITLAWPLTTTH